MAAQADQKTGNPAPSTEHIHRKAAGFVPSLHGRWACWARGLNQHLRLADLRQSFPVRWYHNLPVIQATIANLTALNRHNSLHQKCWHCWWWSRHCQTNLGSTLRAQNTSNQTKNRPNLPWLDDWASYSCSVSFFWQQTSHRCRSDGVASCLPPIPTCFWCGIRRSLAFNPHLCSTDASQHDLCHFGLGIYLSFVF